MQVTDKKANNIINSIEGASIYDNDWNKLKKKRLEYEPKQSLINVIA